MEMKQMAGLEERGIRGEPKRLQVQGQEVVARKQIEGLSTLESPLSKDE